MAKTVRDCALLLEAIAGTDGIDDRQPPFLPSTYMDYTKHLDIFLKSPSEPSKPLRGIKIGVLKEGFTIANMDYNVSVLCKAAVNKLKDLGAEVSPVSIHSHTTASIVWMVSLPIAGGRQGFLADMSGRKQLYMLDRITAASKDGKISQDAFDKLGPGAQNLYLRYLYLYEKFGVELHAKCANLLRKINVRHLIPGAVRSIH